jgi:hypothetical protein
MVRLHGEEVDWRKADVDPMALYASGAERAIDDDPMVPF